MNKKSIKILIISIMLILSTIVLTTTVSADDEAWVVYVTPEEQSVINGSSFEISLTANNTQGGSGSAVGGWEITQLNWTVGLANITSATEGNWLSDVDSTLFSDGDFHNASGNLTDNYCAILGTGDTSVNGTMVTYNFTTLKTGVIEITFYGLFSYGENEIWFAETTGNITVYNDSAPEIVDNSPATGTTGDFFLFNVSVTDDVDSAPALTVKVNWTHDPSSSNDSMEYQGGTYFEKQITLDNSVSDLAYHIYVNDTVPNANYTEELTAGVTDNDKPLNNTKVNVSEKFMGDVTKIFSIDWTNISCNVTDNIAVTGVYLNITINGSIYDNTSVVDNKTADNKYFRNNSFATVGTYVVFLHSYDAASNKNNTENQTYEIFYKWDLNQDNDVNIVDITSITGVYGQTGDNRWIKQDCASTGDGDIDIVDITTVTAHYGETY